MHRGPRIKEKDAREERNAQIEHQYLEEKKSGAELAKAFGLHQNMVYRILRARGVPMRNQPGQVSVEREMRMYRTVELMKAGYSQNAAAKEQGVSRPTIKDDLKLAEAYKLWP